MIQVTSRVTAHIYIYRYINILRVHTKNRRFGIANLRSTISSTFLKCVHLVSKCKNASMFWCLSYGAFFLNTLQITTKTLHVFEIVTVLKRLRFALAHPMSKRPHNASV